MSLSEQIQSAVEYVVSKAKTKGVKAEIIAIAKTQTKIQFQNRVLEQYSLSETAQLGVRILNKKNEGVAYTEDTRKASLDELIEEASSNSKFIEKEWTSQLNSGTQLPQMKELYDAASESVSVDEKMEIARQLEASALDTDPRIHSLPYGLYGDQISTFWIGNTEGLYGSYSTSASYVYGYALAKEGDIAVMGNDTRAGRNPRVISSAIAGSEAARHAISRLSAIRPKTGNYRVVFNSQAAQELLGLITRYFSAKAVDEKKSPFSGKLGENVASPIINFIDDPFSLLGFGGRPFDCEGFPSKKTPLIVNGKLENFLTNSVYARKMKLAHTASASRSPSTDLDIDISNLILEPGNTDLSDVTTGSEPTIVVDTILGSAGFRPNSGDFSLPVEGDLYRNSQKEIALKDFLVSGNILDVLKSVEAVGKEYLPTPGRVAAPFILVPSLSVSGEASATH